jgi:sortase B
MAGNIMFGEIPYFLESDYFDGHSTGLLFTPEHTFTIDFFACVKTNAYDTSFYLPYEVKRDESMCELQDYIKSIASVYKDIGLTKDDQIIALSTCLDTETDGRVLLFGRLSRRAQD